MNKVLFIRRDNIGDLICTTPAIHALRKNFPAAKIGVLVNSYNADAIANNPDIDEIYIYEKAKHAEGKNRLLVWLGNLRLLLKIRGEKYDAAIGCGNYSPSLARYTFLTGAKKRIGYVRSGDRSISYNIPINEPTEPLHEVIATFRLLEPFGIDGEPSRLVLLPSADEKEKVLKFLFPHPTSHIPHPNLIAIHISSRKENNRWQVDKFVELGNMLIKKYNILPMILWAPGSSKNPFHPGDDEKAEAIAKRMFIKPALYKTVNLKELIAAISMCKLVICCDGGAMHIAAALGKPIVTIWGSTDRRRWAPWKTENIILQKGHTADEVSVEEAIGAFETLWQTAVSKAGGYKCH